MNKNPFSQISHGFAPGSTWVHTINVKIKILSALIMLILSGLGSEIWLMSVSLLVFAFAWTANISMREIGRVIRSMSWFFLAIIIFPIIFTSGYYLPIPSWIPFSISVEGLTLALESCVRLIIVLMISTILMKTTSLSDFNKFVVGEGKGRKIFEEIFQVAVMAIEVLPKIFQEAERQLADFKVQKNEKSTLLDTIKLASGQVIPFIVSVFSNMENYAQGK